MLLPDRASRPARVRIENRLSEVPAQAIDLRDGTCSPIALVSCQDGSDYRQIKDMRHFRSPHLLVFNTGSVASDPAETRELTANLR